MKQTIFAAVAIFLLLLVVHAQDKALFHRGRITHLNEEAFPRKPLAMPILASTQVGRATPTSGLPCASKGDVTSALLESISRRKTHAGGGCIRTPLVVDGALRLGAGMYQVLQPIAVKSGGSITGAGWNTVIAESPVEGQLVVIVGSEATVAAFGTNSNITLKNFKIIGANPTYHAAPQTVQLGNCVGCTVDRLWLDRTHTIGIQLGGSAARGYYAKDSRVTNNLLTHVAAQAIAVVNGENIEISGNRILRPGVKGLGGPASIDLECNANSDRLLNIRVVNNTIDHTGSEMAITGNGIIANSTSTPKVGGIVIDNNTITGGRHLPNGIMLAGVHMAGTRVTRNKISGTVQTSMWLTGSRLVVEDNTIENVGGGGVPGFIVDDVKNSVIRRNPLRCTHWACDERMQMRGTNSGNSITDNAGWVITPKGPNDN